MEQIYPKISNKLIECLEIDFPDVLPRREISAFELGKRIGQKEVINKLRNEKIYNEKEIINEDEHL